LDHFCASAVALTVWDSPIGVLLKHGDPGDGGFVWRSVVLGDGGQKLAQPVPNDLTPIHEKMKDNSRMKKLMAVAIETAPGESLTPGLGLSFSFRKKRSRLISSTPWRNWGRATGRTPWESRRAGDSIHL
jgi:hypothetical protein